MKNQITDFMKADPRKRLSITIAVWIIVIASLFSQTPPLTTVGTAAFSSGTWSVPVTVTGFSNVGDISLKLNYDPAILVYTGVTVNTGLNSASTFTTPVTDQSGVFRLSATSASAILLAPPTNTLLTLSFTVKPGIQNNRTLLTWGTGQGDCDITPPPPATFDPQITTANMSTYFINGYIDIPPEPVTNVNLKLYIEGLYAGAGVMRQAQGATGNQFPGTIADLITVELHDATIYANLVHTVTNTSLNTDGTASFTIPSTFNLSYYLTIRHRNSIATVSSVPVSFASGTVNYDFSIAATQAFGSNMKNSAGVFLIYSGDSNQDGFVGVTDMSGVDNLSAIFASGYLTEDINGDGFIGVTDMTIIDNNSANFIFAITP